MRTQIKLTDNNSRLLLLTAVELFLQSYGSHQLGHDIFAFHSPLTGRITKIRHVNHRYDKQTEALLFDYKSLRRDLLDETVTDFNSYQSAELSVVIDNYLREFASKLSKQSLDQLKGLNRSLEQTIQANQKARAEQGGQQ